MTRPKGLRYKRPFDLALLVVSHVVLAPILLVAWIVIPLAILLVDGRPILYVQKRAGLGGHPFNVYKFRTMANGSTDRGPLYTAEGDPRLTRLGPFLRRTALDELPQLFNIWKGDMSLVGPRAIPWGTHEQYIREHPPFAQRYQVLPGLTGYAALRLPRHCSAMERLGEDLRYVQDAGPWTDVKLLFESVWVTLAGRWGSGHRKVREVETTAALVPAQLGQTPR